MFNVYGELLYNEDTYTGPGYSGVWTNSYQFDYLKGTTVLVTFTPNWTVPEGTSVMVGIGESLSKLQVVHPNKKTPILFVDSTTGLTNIFVRLYLDSNIYGATPVITSFNILIEQESSLYTVATSVLEDGLTASGVEYFIDPLTQNILIPYSWINPTKHRNALKQIAESCGGVAYQDKQGVVRLESALYANGNAIKDTILQDRIIDASAPVSEVKNEVRITTSPYVTLPQETVWELQGDNIINAGESRTFEIFFSDYDAVIDASAVLSSAPAGATITSEVWYTWGGRITIEGSAVGQELTLSAVGKPLVIRGSRIITESDSASIRRNGLRSFSIENNQLIQDAQIAEIIGEAIVSTLGNERRDIETQWRGDPTLELGDRVNIDGQTGNIVEQQIKYNGALSSSIKVRRSNG
jgi:hypothetical protein